MSMHANGTTPVILFAGGQSLDAETIGSIIKPAFAKYGRPRVAYIGAANGDRASFFEMVRPLLLGAGAATVDFCRLASDGAAAVGEVAEAKAFLDSADVVFLSGGEVEDGINRIEKHGLAGTLRGLYNKGKLFIGISAGTIMLGEWWVRWEIEGDDSTASLFRCLGIVPATFDTHAEDEDWVELKTALRLLAGRRDDGQPGGAASPRGYGLPRGGIISADGQGNLANLSKEYLTFIYENGDFTCV